MRRFCLLILVATLGGCAATSAPSPGPALLTSWGPLGVSCADPVVGMPDNLPQWRCQATIRGLSVGLDFMADDAGVVEINAQVPAGTDPAAARAAFDDLVSSMDAFASAHTRLVGWIGAWSGGRGQISTEFAGGHATIESDETWVGLFLDRVPRFVPVSPGQLPMTSLGLPNGDAARLRVYTLPSM